MLVVTLKSFVTNNSSITHPSIPNTNSIFFVVHRRKRNSKRTPVFQSKAGRSPKSHQPIFGTDQRASSRNLEEILNFAVSKRSYHQTELRRGRSDLYSGQRATLSTSDCGLPCLLTGCRSGTIHVVGYGLRHDFQHDH